MTVREDTDFLATLAGKRVALVGPAGYLVGQGRGPEFDAHDVVVRMNLSYARDEALGPDYGTRTDALYSIITNPGRAAVKVSDVQAMHADGVQWILSKWGPRSRHPDRWRRIVPLAAEFGIDIAAIDPRFVGALRVELVSEPHTGPLTIIHLLTSDLASLTVAGLDFYASGYQPGYGGLSDQETSRIAEVAAETDLGEWTWVSHEFARGIDRGAQTRLLARLAAEDTRLVLDAPLAERLREAVTA